MLHKKIYRILGRQNERNFCYVRMALTSIFGLCFMSVCLINSNCYSLIYSSLYSALLCDFCILENPISISGVQWMSPHWLLPAALPVPSIHCSFSWHPNFSVSNCDEYFQFGASSDKIHKINRCSGSCVMLSYDGFWCSSSHAGNSRSRYQYTSSKIKPHNCHQKNLNIHHKIRTWLSCSEKGF